MSLSLDVKVHSRWQWAPHTKLQACCYRV